MKRLITLVNFILVFLFISWELNAQVALPTFQGVQAAGLGLIRSKGLTGSQDLQVGYTVTKDMYTTTRTLLSYQSPTGSGFSLGTSSYWRDWGNDIWDYFGFFYIMEGSNNSPSPVILTPVNQADGTISTQTDTHHSKSFTIKHGWVAQGIFRIDISCADTDFAWRFGMFGNIGSDGSTNNSMTSYTSSTLGITIHYNWNYQTSTTYEKFGIYMVPYVQTEAQTTYMFRGIDRDNLGVWSAEITQGINVYFSKTYDVKLWVENDLEIQ